MKRKRTLRSATRQGIFGWNSSAPMSTGSGGQMPFPAFHLNIGSIDSQCLGKLMQQVVAQWPPYLSLPVEPRTRPAAGSRVPSVGVSGCRPFPGTQGSRCNSVSPFWIHARQTEIVNERLLSIGLQPGFEDVDSRCNLILPAISWVDLRDTSACSAWQRQLVTAAFTFARISCALFIPCCLPNA